MCNTHATATVATALGTFVLTADDDGLRQLLFPFSLSSPPPPELQPRSPLLHEAARQLRAYLAGTLKQFDLPLSLHGTPFQLQVWQQLQNIAYGQTLTYGELATALGDKHKARAVGGAAHRNPVGIIVPCHRLIGAGGQLTGFGGGLPMKQRLLELEGIVINELKKQV